MSSPSQLPDPSILAHITDVHCHPTDAPSDVSAESMERLPISICAMSSMQFDQEKVKTLANRYPDKVTPAFGYHPWFSHWISTERSLATQSIENQDVSEKERHYRSLFLPSAPQEAEFVELLPHLPDPTPLSTILNTLRDNLSLFSSAMLGEVGLDRMFRVSTDYSASPRILTSFRIPIEHQIEILESQMAVAVEMGRNISLHSVKSQLATLELFDRMRAKYQDGWRRISIDLHSCGFSKQGWKDLEKKHENVFMSLSTVINLKHPNLRELIVACSKDRILVESDYNDIDFVTSQTWDMVKLIAEVRGWPIETEWLDEDKLQDSEWGVVRRLEKNWEVFKHGGHSVRENERKKRNIIDYASDASDTEES